MNKVPHTSQQSSYPWSMYESNKELLSYIGAASVAEWLVSSVLDLCCYWCGKCSPPLCCSLPCGTWDKTLSRHYAMQTGMCMQSQGRVGSHV